LGEGTDNYLVIPVAAATGNSINCRIGGIVNPSGAADLLIDYFVANPAFIRYKDGKIEALI
jgi:hypothetical protein